MATKEAEKPVTLPDCIEEVLNLIRDVQLKTRWDVESATRVIALAQKQLELARAKG